MVPDYYRTLEVDPEASIEVIEKAFRALSLKYHPDTADRQDQEAGRKWIAVREAYEVLSDEAKRKAYDALRKREMLDLFLNEGVIGLARRYLRP